MYDQTITDCIGLEKRERIIGIKNNTLVWEVALSNNTGYTCTIRIEQDSRKQTVSLPDFFQYVRLVLEALIGIDGETEECYARFSRKWRDTYGHNNKCSRETFTHFLNLKKKMRLLFGNLYPVLEYSSELSRF